MNPAVIIKDAAADGVSLALTPAGTIKAKGDAAAINRWLPVIREHKPEIMAALQDAANDAPGWRWLMRYPDGFGEVRFSPEVTRRAALETCPGAIAAEPSPEAPERTPTDARRDRVLAMLAERPNTRYAVLVDNPVSDPVLLTLAIRGQATCDLAIPAANFDPFDLLAMLDRHGAVIH